MCLVTSRISPSDVPTCLSHCIVIRETFSMHPLESLRHSTDNPVCASTFDYTITTCSTDPLPFQPSTPNQNKTPTLTHPFLEQEVNKHVAGNKIYRASLTFFTAAFCCASSFSMTVRLCVDVRADEMLSVGTAATPYARSGLRLT
ncbi:hypothetical protein CEXT_402871 [Caerostris extrusa]|uniref:Uncharacterized protein n=1 Tax=Caerostris extrusa TaxID=172846 RepID=A0AAV4QR53_CAEEX|nr:hypothetical protein CEXT_402871 [Caerostris extrusa]